MPDPLTPEQIELLRSLPRPFSEVRDDPRGLSLYAMGLVAREGQRGERVLRTHFGDILLATIDAETAALKARIAELEGVLGELTSRLDERKVLSFLATGEAPASIEYDSFYLELRAAKATLAPTTSGEGKG